MRPHAALAHFGLRTSQRLSQTKQVQVSNGDLSDWVRARDPIGEDPRVHPEGTQGKAEEFFRPLPPELVALLEELGPPPEDAYPDLPGWARALLFHHDEGTLDLERLGAFALEGGERGSDDALTLGFEGVCIELWPGGAAQLVVAKPKAIAEESEAEWMHAKLSDYWDVNVDAVGAAAKRIGPLEGPARQAALDEISAAVDSHLGVLDRNWLIQLSPSLVDDLYKAASRMLAFDGEIHDYLQVAIKPIVDALAKEGILVQYLVDNSWPDWEGAADLVGTWFRFAGLGFVCAQELARELVLEAKADGKGPPEAGELPALARQAANEVVAEQQELGGSFIQLDMDMEAGSFEQAIRRAGSEGVVTVIRSEAPDPGTRIKLRYPEGFEPRS